MKDLPDQVVWEIMSKIHETRDRNSLSLSCKRFRDIDNEQRSFLRVGLGLIPANQALTQICLRFPNLTKLEINNRDWMSNLGSQLKDEAFSILSNHCRSLSDLRLKHCLFITDAGLSKLSSSFPSLNSLWLKSAPGITARGIQSVVSGCEKLSELGIVRCVNVAADEWLERLGVIGRVESLSIGNCRLIGEDELVKLGLGWKGLRRLRFEVDPAYRRVNVNDQLDVDKWRFFQEVSCPKMKELSLTNCDINPGGVLSRLLRKCKGLESVELNMCSGLRDRDIAALARSSTALRSISFRVSLDDIQFSLTDDSLRAISRNCPAVESVTVRFFYKAVPLSSSFTMLGILDLVMKCPVKKLCLEQFYLLDDSGLRALCSDRSDLVELDIVRCSEISDEGLVFVSRFSSLRVLRLIKCIGLTDEGFRPFVESRTLDRIVVDECPMISARALVGTAKVVFFRHDMIWMF